MTDQASVRPAQDEVGDEIDLFDLLQVIADNLRLLVLGPLVVGLTALAISFLVPPTFTATTTFLPPQQQQSAAAAMMLQSLGALGGIAGAATGIKNPVDQYAAFMESNSIRDSLIDRFKLIERYDVDYRDDAREIMEKKAIRVSAGRKDGLVTIEVDDYEPKFAADLANAHIEELTRLLGRIAVTEAQERRVFFERELKKIKDGLTRAEAALKATGINESALKANPEAAVGSVASLMAQVVAKEVQLGAMRNYLTEGAPDFKRAQSELSALRGQLVKAEKDTISANDGSDYVAKYRDFKYYETLFELMAKQYELARLDESREGAVIQVVDVAVPPDRNRKPKKVLIAVIATIAASFFLLIFVFVRQSIRNSIRDMDGGARMKELQLAFKRAFGRE